MVEKLRLKKLFVSLCLIIQRVLFCFVFIHLMNKDYDEHRYEIDYPVLSTAIDFYDHIASSFFNTIQYQCSREKQINSFFDKEESTDNGNYAFIENLNCIQTRHDIKKFVHNSELQICRIYSEIDNFSYDKVHFFITVRKYKFLKRNKVFLSVECNGVSLEPLIII